MRRVKSVVRAIKRGKMRIRKIESVNDYIFEIKTRNGDWIKYNF